MSATSSGDTASARASTSSIVASRTCRSSPRWSSVSSGSRPSARTVTISLAARSSLIWLRPRKPSATITVVAPVRSTRSATSWPV